MATEKDLQFLEYIFRNTESGTLKWESTADDNTFTVSLKGKYKVTIARGRDDEDESFYCLTLFDEADRELLTAYHSESRFVYQLFTLAKRNSLNVDSTLDEIMSDESKRVADEDSPF
jgi:hypothetical protein